MMYVAVWPPIGPRLGPRWTEGAENDMDKKLDPTFLCDFYAPSYTVLTQFTLVPVGRTYRRTETACISTRNSRSSFRLKQFNQSKPVTLRRRWGTPTDASVSCSVLQRAKEKQWLLIATVGERWSKGRRGWVERVLPCKAKVVGSTPTRATA